MVGSAEDVQARDVREKVFLEEEAEAARRAVLGTPEATALPVAQAIAFLRVQVA